MESGIRCESQPLENTHKFLNLFRRELSEPEYYLDPRESLRSECLVGVKLLFSCLKQSSSELPTGPLQQLYTAGFDEDQVWEEVQLVNEPAICRLSATVEGLGPGLQLLATKQAIEEGEDKHILNSVEETEEKSNDSEEVLSTCSDGQEVEVQGVSKEPRRPDVEDEFFNLSDMEQYLDKADLLSDHGSENSVGALAEQLSDSGSDQLHYRDFFDPPLVSQEDVCGGEEVDEVDKQQLSSHETRQLKLASQIRSIEAANVSQKSWQMSGEVSSSSRPLNSLLEEVVDFNPMTAPPPVITEEITHSLEEMIRQRILDQAWDDVQRKVKPLERPYDYQRARPLNQEKSKKSLAEIYEEDYIKQTQEASQHHEGMEEKEDPRHTEVEELKTRLFLKLDALSNFHFTPKPPQSEVCVVSNVPAVVMEEITPLATAQHTLLAPEEIQAKSRAPEKGESERTATDRRRLRVAKKWLKRRHGQSRMPGTVSGRSKVRPGNGRSKVRPGKSTLHSSRHFFASLQQQAKVTSKKQTPSNRTSTHFLL